MIVCEFSRARHERLIMMERLDLSDFDVRPPMGVHLARVKFVVVCTRAPLRIFSKAKEIY